MASSRATLERIGARVPVPQPAFDRLMRRRARKRRNQRIASAVLALILAIGAIGAAIRVFEAGERQLPANQPITPKNVARLQLLDSPFVGGHLVSVQVSDGLAYVVSRKGHQAKLIAFPDACSADCRPAWIADTGEAEPRNGSAAADGMVYVATDDLYAFSATCGSGGATCEPAWVGHVNGRPYGPVLGSDAVYVASNRKLYSFPTSCGATGGACRPNWVSVELPGPGGFHHPVVVHSTVYVAACCAARQSRSYETFPADCGTVGATCVALRGAPPPPPLGQTIADGKALIGNVDSGGVSAYPSGCTTYGSPRAVSPPTCRPMWTTAGLSSNRGGFVAPGDGLLFVHQQHGGCCGNYSGPRGGILVYPTDCGTGNARCKPAWTWGTGDGARPSVPITDLAVSASRLYAGSGDGHLYVFGPGPDVAERSFGRAPSPLPTLMFYLGLAAVAAVLLLMRRVRRRAA